MYWSEYIELANKRPQVAGLEKKNQNSTCPADKQLSNFACPGQVFVYFYYDLMGR